MVLYKSPHGSIALSLSVSIRAAVSAIVIVTSSFMSSLSTALIKPSIIVSSSTLSAPKISVLMVTLRLLLNVGLLHLFDDIILKLDVFDEIASKIYFRKL